MEKYFSLNSHVKLQINIKEPLTNKTYYVACIHSPMMLHIKWVPSFPLSVAAEAVKKIIVLLIYITDFF